MRGRPGRRFLLAAMLMTAVSGCGDSSPAAPAGVTFTKVDLPAGARPVTLSADGDGLIIGVRRDGQPVAPGVLRRGPDGAINTRNNWVPW